MVAAGGRLKWSIYTHVHIYVGDLSVDQIKKVFLFFYVCYPYFKQYAKISECDELTSIAMQPQQKSIMKEYYRRRLSMIFKSYSLTTLTRDSSVMR